VADLRAPFPWFGGKSRAADAVWAALGHDVAAYCEPFAGSLAVLLGRPGGAGRVETVNDADGHLVNVWRAIAHAPDEVARWADWPVMEADLTARHLWLVERTETIREAVAADPDWYDAKAAGWWLWGIAGWIGSGWCSGDGPWVRDGLRVVNGNAGRGVHRQLLHLGNAGRGVHRQLLHLGDAGRGDPPALEWMRALSARLRRVRVAQGDWSRVVSSSAFGPAAYPAGSPVGVFLDPPYPEGWDAGGAYAGQSGCVDALWSAVTTWAAEEGERPDRRIVVAGYAGTWTPPAGWRETTWHARKGYATHEARQRERLWLSPHCLGARQGGLFGGAR